MVSSSKTSYHCSNSVTSLYYHLYDVSKYFRYRRMHQVDHFSSQDERGINWLEILFRLSRVGGREGEGGEGEKGGRGEGV